jgi:hypothetical protein
MIIAPGRVAAVGIRVTVSRDVRPALLRLPWPRARLVRLAGRFSRWGIRGPQSFGFIASLASSGVAEFLLILHRS